MNSLKKQLLYLISTLPVFIAGNGSCAAEQTIEEIVIIGDQLFKDTTVVSPTSIITAEDLASINMSTVEDALMYEPNLIIRKRFIGDPNGVIGMRGSNMFQGSRTTDLRICHTGRKQHNLITSPPLIKVYFCES